MRSVMWRMAAKATKLVQQSLSERMCAAPGARRSELTADIPEPCFVVFGHLVAAGLLARSLYLRKNAPSVVEHGPVPVPKLRALGRARGAAAASGWGWAAVGPAGPPLVHTRA
jgi:hypothetical protein